MERCWQHCLGLCLQVGTNPFVAVPTQSAADASGSGSGSGSGPPIKFLPIPPLASTESTTSTFADPFALQPAATNPFELPTPANPFEPNLSIGPTVSVTSTSEHAPEPLNRTHSFSEFKGRHFRSIDLSGHNADAAKQPLCDHRLNPVNPAEFR